MIHLKLPKEVLGKKLCAVGYRVLCKPLTVEKEIKTQSGIIYKPEQTVDGEKGAMDRGEVIAIGPYAFRDERAGQMEPWCKIGDIVIWPSYAGKPIDTEEHGTIHVLNDLDILAKYVE